MCGNSVKYRIICKYTFMILYCQIQVMHRDVKNKEDYPKMNVLFVLRFYGPVNLMESC